MRARNAVLAFSLIAHCGYAQMTIMSNGNAPLTGPNSYRYDDQYNGANGRPNNGRSTYGDSSETAWASDGTIFQTFGDGSGFSVNNSSTCPKNNMPLGWFTGTYPYLNGVNINCMSNFGTWGQTNIGLCGTVTGSWKPAGLISINDRQTIGAGPHSWYLIVTCATTSIPFYSTYPTLLYSPDDGVTWCAPGHTGAQCSTAGDVPSVAQFTSTKVRIIRFVQYEQGDTGTATIDQHNLYVYAFAAGNPGGYSLYLMRAARGSNLQCGPNNASALSCTNPWQFYTGAVGGDITNNSNWNSSDASATVILPPNVNDGSYRYIPGLNYIKTDTASQNYDMAYYATKTLTGPWTKMYYEPPNATYLYGFPAMDLSSITVTSTNPFQATGWVGYTGSYLCQTDDPTTNCYSQFWRKATISATPGGWQIQ